MHCLKYGLTANNVLGIEMVLIDGEVVRLGGKHLDAEGYDLLGLMTGSEGLLGVVTEVTVRILQAPETARAMLVGFPSSEEAGQCVADIIGAGIIPGGMEMMDRPAIHAAEEFRPCRLSARRRGAADRGTGRPQAEVDHLLSRVEEIAARNGATTSRVSNSDTERAAFWAGRKAAFPAGGADFARLLLHGRHHPAQGTAQGAGRHAGDVGEVRPAGRQCLSCRRRQSASAHPLRRQQAGGNWNARKSSAPISSGCAWPWAAC